MEPEITLEQKEQLSTWAGQRDALLSEISNLTTEKERLENTNKEKALSSTDMDNRVNQSIGRIEELDKTQVVLADTISKSTAGLLVQKSILEVEIEGLTKVIKLLTPQKESLEKDILSLTDIFNTMNERTGMLEQIVGHVTKASEVNKTVIDGLVESVKKSSQEIIDLNEKNVAATNDVLNKLPAMLMELQKNKLIKNKI